MSYFGMWKSTFLTPGLFQIPQLHPVCFRHFVPGAPVCWTSVCKLDGKSRMRAAPAFSFGKIIHFLSDVSKWQDFTLNHTGVHTLLAAKVRPQPAAHTTVQSVWDKQHIPKTQKWQCNFGFLGPIKDQQRELNDTNAKPNSTPIQINSP